jgi:hypothetical protein
MEPMEAGYYNRAKTERKGSTSSDDCGLQRLTRIVKCRVEVDPSLKIEIDLLQGEEVRLAT